MKKKCIIAFLQFIAIATSPFSEELTKEEAANIKSDIYRLHSEKITELEDDKKTFFDDGFRNLIAETPDGALSIVKKRIAEGQYASCTNDDWVYRITRDIKIGYERLSDYTENIPVIEKRITKLLFNFYSYTCNRDGANQAAFDEFSKIAPDVLQEKNLQYIPNWIFTFGNVIPLHHYLKIQVVHITSYNGVKPENAIIASFDGADGRKKMIHITQAKKGNGCQSEMLAVKAHAVINPTQSDRNVQGVRIGLSSSTHPSLRLINNNGNVHTHPSRNDSIALSPNNMHISGFPEGISEFTNPDEIYSFTTHVDYDAEDIHIDTFHLLLPRVDETIGIQPIYEICRKSYFLNDRGIIQKEPIKERLITFLTFVEKVEQTAYFETSPSFQQCWQAMKEFVVWNS
ncbi:MAG: hypothetical protein C0432_05910 [Candidatus Puniceispirillum sp.]|nr:hypothetical protein [Candidatus Pelagibacter sp.]MBA4283810.1 hypothetical protein [Candidatus Puniceispirillum sp.]